MGSVISSPQAFGEDDLSANDKKEPVDPLLEKLRNLHVVTPILKQQTTDTSLTSLLLRQSSSHASALDPTSTAKLFGLYQEWQKGTAEKVGKNQAELGHKIIGVEELSMKLLQRLNYASRVMEASAAHLQEVDSLQIEISEMKRSLTDTLQHYERLNQKIESLGLETVIAKPMPIVNKLHCEEQDVSLATPSIVSHEVVRADS